MVLSLLGRLSAQNVSNEGKVFWVGHMGHIDGTGSNFALYITTAASTTAAVRVTIPGTSYNQVVFVAPNQVAVHTLPSSQTYLNCSDCILNKGVKVESLNHPIVVYAHIYSNARSDATLLIPVETLGKEYYALAFTQSPVSNTQRSEFMLIGVEDSTFVDIYPTVDILPSKSANTRYTVMLNEGEVYHAQSNTDVTGTRIVARSADGIACKKVAAFSGSSFTRIGCSNATTGDNLYQQLFPTTSWGMEFLTAPLKTRNTDQFRVLAKYDSTRVTINGASPVMIHEGEYHSFQTAEANYIKSDKPVTLAQYPRTQGCDGVTGDPTLIVIPPIEQMVNKVTMYSSPYQNITGQYLNIITKLSDTGKFFLDNNKVPFQMLANNALYAYSQMTVSSGNHRMISDSNFQVVAYGFGNVEAYGYAGGTNIKNLVQSISVSRDSMCLGDTLRLTANVNYLPTSLKWYFGDGTTDTLNYKPVHVYTTSGEYAISLVTRKDGLVDCGSTDSTVYRIKVHDHPSAAFSINAHCLLDTFAFIDSSRSNSSFSHVSKWEWTFGDSTVSVLQSPVKYFSRTGTFPTMLKVWNNNLCPDSIQGLHYVNPHPEVSWTHNDTCPGSPARFINTATLASGSLMNRDWLFDSTVSQSGDTVFFTSLIPGYHDVMLELRSDSGCYAYRSDSFRIYEKPVAGFTVNDHCFGQSFVPVDTSLLADYFDWDYGETGYSGAAQAYTFLDSGVHTLSLRVWSLQGCADSAFRDVEVFALPPAHFTVQGTCQEDDFLFAPGFDTGQYAGNFNWLIDTQPLNGAVQSRNMVVSGWFNARLRVSSVHNCKDSSSAVFYVNPKPDAEPRFYPECENVPALIRDESDYKGSSTFLRTWTTELGSRNDSAWWLDPKDYPSSQVLLEIETDSGCKDTQVQTVRYHPLPEVSFEVMGKCPNESLEMWYPGNPPWKDPIAAYRWNLNGTTVSADSFYAFLPGQGGTYSLELRIQSDKNCMDSSRQDITILEVPVPAVEEFPACEGQDIRLSDRSILVGSDGISIRTWNLNGLPSQTGTDAVFNPGIAGYIPYTLSLETDSGCVYPDIYSDSVEVYAYPKAAFGVDPRLGIVGEQVFRFTGRSERASIFAWDFGDGTLSSMISPTHLYADTGLWTVKLWVANAAGCADSTYDTLFVFPPLSCEVPNAFTPNYDFLNDAFGPVCEGLKAFRMDIYDRWGERIFHTSDSELWYPLRDEPVVPAGVYLYRIVAFDYTGDFRTYTGTVVVIY